jgi:hypothetical protein
MIALCVIGMMVIDIQLSLRKVKFRYIFLINVIMGLFIKLIFQSL